MRWVFIRDLLSEDVTQLHKVEWQDDNECGIGICVSVAVAQLKVMFQHFHRLPEIAVFFPCFHFSLPLTSPLLLYVLFSSTCISVKTCIKIGYRNNFITHSCTLCIYSCAINLFKKKIGGGHRNAQRRSILLRNMTCTLLNTSGPVSQCLQIAKCIHRVPRNVVCRSLIQRTWQMNT
jgi:uncharacterized protein YejL (UPF0352 family)